MNNGLKYRLLPIIVALFAALSPLKAQNGTPDSVDVLHYNIKLDIGNRTDKRMEGSTEIRMVVLRQMDSVGLELCTSDIDSILVNGQSSGFSYLANSKLLKVPFVGMIGDTVTVEVFYRKGQYIMPQGWGGFYFDNNIYYNLGIAIYEYPHNAGKAWFPCRDNFTDRATYRFEITAKPGWKTICSGMLDTVISNGDGSSTWCWDLNKQTPTYLVGVAVAPFHIIEREYVSEYATYPAILGFLNHDSTNVWRTYENMSKVIPMFERCFGPYRWDRVGYVSTPKGSMEHSANIAFTTNCMASQQEACLATMSHEFAHSWFGNLITCANSKDMWINEGGASFCEEVAIQAITMDDNPLYYRDFARANLRDVLLNTHVTDGGFKPLYGQTWQYTYGSTVYNKGATVWHSLRGYMGDSLFYASLRTLFDHSAFQNLDSWQLRDSLSLYSGMVLTDFFDFHVFRPGFVDYVIDSLHTTGSGTTVYVRQKLYGTDTMMNGNRVWITFFSPELTTEKRLVTFDGLSTSATFQLPFAPSFAVVDYDEELSKASLAQHVTIKEKATYYLEDAMFRAVARKVVSNDSAWLHVTHHWSSPDAPTTPLIEKMADHYWTVEGRLPEGFNLSGMFLYSRSGDNGTLDADFITSSDDFAKLRLMYRHNAGERWKVVSSHHSDNLSQGYFTDNSLKCGEYTLAMIDTGYVTVEVPTGKQAYSIYPNPTSGKIVIDGPESDNSFEVEVVGVDGKTVCRRGEVHSGQELDLGLRSGFYVVNVKSRNGQLLASRKIQVF